jgi:hypothetical protein
VAVPSVDDLAGLVGREVNEVQAQAVLAIVSAQAKSYTAGRGWDTAGEPYNDVWAVILTAAARRLTDPTQTVTDRRMGPFAESFQPIDGWSTSELYVLDRYRERVR